MDKLVRNPTFDKRPCRYAPGPWMCTCISFDWKNFEHRTRLSRNPPSIWSEVQCFPPSWTECIFLVFSFIRRVFFFLRSPLTSFPLSSPRRPSLGSGNLRQVTAAIGYWNPERRWLRKLRMFSRFVTSFPFPTRSYLVAKILLLPFFIAFSSFLPLSVAFAASRRHCRITKNRRSRGSWLHVSSRARRCRHLIPYSENLTPGVLRPSRHAGLNHPLAHRKLILFFSTIPTERSENAWRRKCYRKT